MIYLNDVPINPTIFPDNTSQVWKLPEDILSKPHVYVRWDFQHEGELVQLAQLKTLLDYHGTEVSLDLDYLPYGRQDKPVSNKTTFALRSFADLLNSLNFSVVSCLDPHSWVASLYISNFVREYPEQELRKVIQVIKNDIICYPDHGAQYKYSKVYPDLHYTYGQKYRDELTGKIIDYRMVGENPVGLNVLIVDDICDGGNTFVLLAKELYKAGAKEVNLFISHGIFSNGLNYVKGSGIQRIFTPKGEVSEINGVLTYRRI